MLIWKSAPRRSQSTGGGGGSRELWESSKVRLLFFWCSFPQHGGDQETVQLNLPADIASEAAAYEDLLWRYGPVGMRQAQSMGCSSLEVADQSWGGAQDEWERWSEWGVQEEGQADIQWNVVCQEEGGGQGKLKKEQDWRTRLENQNEDRQGPRRTRVARRHAE